MSLSDKIILSAQGYFELEMNDEAIRELDKLPLPEQIRTDVLEMRVLILMKDHRWQEALGASEKLCALHPQGAIGFIHTAYCLHELKQTRHAIDVLLEGPPSLVDQATYHYNLACYECSLGHLDVARAYLSTSLSMDKSLRELAATDPDLKALQE